MTEYVIFLIGISATVFSLWSTVPQISKSLRTKKTDDVSKWLIISLIIGLSLWVIYGIMKGDIVIASANAIGVTLNLILFGLKIKYTVQKWVEYYVDTLPMGFEQTYSPYRRMNGWYSFALNYTSATNYKNNSSYGRYEMMLVYYRNCMVSWTTFWTRGMIE